MAIFDTLSNTNSILGNTQSATKSLSSIVTGIGGINSISSAVSKLGSASNVISSVNALGLDIPGLGMVSKISRGLGNLHGSITSAKAIAATIPGFGAATAALGKALPAMPSLFGSSTPASTHDRHDFFRKNIGFAKPTKYRVNMSLNMPGNIPAFDRYVEDTNFSCTSASLPGESVATFDVRRGKPIQTKLPYDLIYSELRLIFRVSHDHKERTLFEAWHNYIYDKTTNSFRYPEQYYGTIDITQLSNDMKKIKTVRCYEAYPTTLSAIALAYDADNVVETFDVLFAYTSWESI